jgi:hypothetical protein
MKLSPTTRILLISSSLWYFGEGLFGPLFAVFAEKIGGDLLDITSAWALYLISTGIFYFLLGRLIKTSAYKHHFLVLGYGLNALLTFGYIFVENTYHLFVIQVGLGFAEALCTPIWDSLFASNIDDNEDISYWGIANGHSQFVSGIAIAIGGLIANYLSFNTLFIIMGIVQLLATAVQARLLIKQ